MTTQIAVKLPSELGAALDELVDRGVYPNRSQAVRVAVEALVRRSAAERIDAAFADGFTRHPEGPKRSPMRRVSPSRRSRTSPGCRGGRTQRSVVLRPFPKAMLVRRLGAVPAPRRHLICTVAAATLDC